MSLINDALKRAGQNRTPEDPRSRAPHPGRGLEPAMHHRGPAPWFTFLLAGACLVSLLTAGFLMIVWMRSTTQTDVAPAAHSGLPRAESDASNPTHRDLTLVESPITASAESGPIAGGPFPIIDSSGTMGKRTSPPAADTVTAGSQGASSDGSPSTEAPEMPAEAGLAAAQAGNGKPETPTLKLQAIIYHPENPIVLINGRELAVGDRFDEHIEVISIERSGVTLRNRGKTERLKLY